MSNDILELKSRRNIFNLIKENPGLHLSKIAETLGMRISLVEYHLIFLIRNQIVIAVKESGYLRFYVKGRVGFQDKKILSLLRQNIPLRIVLYMLKNSECKHKDICFNIEAAPSTISYHLKKLVKCGLLSVQTYGENKGYTIVNRDIIIKILIHYKPYNLIDSFKDIWVDLSAI